MLANKDLYINIIKMMQRLILFTYTHTHTPGHVISEIY